MTRNEPRGKGRGIRADSNQMSEPVDCKSNTNRKPDYADAEADDELRIEGQAKVVQSDLEV